MEIDLNLWIIHGHIHVKIVRVSWGKVKELFYDDDSVLEKRKIGSFMPTYFMDVPKAILVN